jgi:hypothetical protein
MLMAEARVETDRPGRYLTQLCQHLDNKGRHLGAGGGRMARHQPGGHQSDHRRPGLAEQVRVEWQPRQKKRLAAARPSTRRSAGGPGHRRPGWRIRRNTFYRCRCRGDSNRPGAWQPQAERIANHARFGARAAPLLAFPAQLTGVPATWQVSGALYVRDGTALRALGYTLSARPAIYPIGQSQYGLPDVRFNLAGANPSCPRPLQSSPAHRVVNGYRVTVSHYNSGTGIPEQMLCAPHASGLTVVVTVTGKHPAPDAVSLFAHHLRLLGTDPAHWTRNPIG